MERGRGGIASSQQPAAARITFSFHIFRAMGTRRPRLWHTRRESRGSCDPGHSVRGVPDSRRSSPVPPRRIGRNEGLLPSRPRCDNDGRIPKRGPAPLTVRFEETKDRWAEACGAGIPTGGRFGCRPIPPSSSADTGARAVSNQFARRSIVTCRFEPPQWTRAVRNSAAALHCVLRRGSAGVLRG